ncbi:hypothetical protein ACFW6V_14080 [Streptomyces sp. NPDC058734]|uniref:hypothetical protein n=1 Tax=Streptomyces sp. NPDC058734 TaxID=3346615 RepID=UPI0036B67107
MERTGDGRVRVLIAPCPEYDVLQFSIFSKGGSVGYRVWAISNNAMRGPLGEIELFSPPTGWRVTEETLKDVKGAHSYTMNVDGAVRGYGVDGRLVFTPRQIEALSPGKVLVANRDGAKLASRLDFMKKDPDRCRQ